MNWVPLIPGNEWTEVHIIKDSIVGGPPGLELYRVVAWRVETGEVNHFPLARYLITLMVFSRWS